MVKKKEEKKTGVDGKEEVKKRLKVGKTGS